MEAFEALFNTVLVVFIMATMLSAGFNTTFDQIEKFFRKPVLVVLVLVVAFVLRPLVGWGTAELFDLALPAFIALVLMWSAPGAPLGVKWVVTAGADVQTGAIAQVLLAAIGSITFAPTANAIIGAADLGSEVSLPVGDLIKTVAFLQLVPFAVGVLMRHWTPSRALEWDIPAKKASALTFVAVVAGAVLGSWETVVDLVGSRTLIAAVVATAVLIAAGYFVSAGAAPTRRATALVQPGSNSGPVFAAVAIAFQNDPEILGAVTAMIFMQLVVGTMIASYWGRESNPAGETSATR